MKRILSIFLLTSVLMGCSSSPADKTNPVVEQYLLEHIAHPDTYKPRKTDVYAQGTIDVHNTQYWQNIPKEGIIDVVVLRHEFSNVDVNGNPSENVFYFYMNPSMDLLYYAHKDKGFLLFPLDE